ncbi:MAG TPA: acyl-CoA carboxylase subunit epsilon [Propionibacteriaceae bacterium]|jgi:Acyl-CoA carboxylase epsilon subunit|nr:acyl-CoA carboxylase subunit epsilon [Propionibacteriaceae bacterium]
MSSPDDQQPVFIVVKGSPTEDELAAVMTVLSTRFAAKHREDAAPARTGWSAYWRSVRSPIQPGPSAWRMSARPQ